MTHTDGDPGEMDELTPLTDAEAAVSAALGDAFREEGDPAVSGNLAATAVSLQSSIGNGAASGGASPRATVLGGLAWRLQNMSDSLTARFGRMGTRTAVGAIAGVSLMGGLAAADALPDPVQNSVSEVAGVVGIDLPDPDDRIDQLRADAEELREQADALDDEADEIEASLEEDDQFLDDEGEELGEEDDFDDDDLDDDEGEEDDFDDGDDDLEEDDFDDKGDDEGEDIGELLETVTADAEDALALADALEMLAGDGELPQETTEALLQLVAELRGLIPDLESASDLAERLGDLLDEAGITLEDLEAEEDDGDDGDDFDEGDDDGDDDLEEDDVDDDEDRDDDIDDDQDEDEDDNEDDEDEDDNEDDEDEDEDEDDNEDDEDEDGDDD